MKILYISLNYEQLLSRASSMGGNVEEVPPLKIDCPQKIKIKKDI